MNFLPIHKPQKGYSTINSYLFKIGYKVVNAEVSLRVIFSMTHVCE